MIRRLALSLAAVLVALASNAHAQAAADFQKILDTYSKALDSNDVETLVGLYASNGVLVREDKPPAIGKEALRAAYKDTFATLKAALAFKVQDAEQSGELGWARSVATGKVKVLATGKETSDSYNELIVFRREGGAWKIRTYFYASSK